MTTKSMRAEDEAALFATALDALSEGKSSDVLSRVERGTQLRPTSARLWHVRALLLRDLDQRRDALEAFARARALAPHQPKIALGHAQTLFEAGLSAVNAFAEALRLNTGNSEVIIGLTQALLAEGRNDEARDGLASLLQRSPAWVEGHEQLASIRWMAGERNGFARSHATALEKLPKHVGLRRSQLITLLHADRYDEVLDAIAAGRRVLGDDLLFDANEAIALSEAGNIEEADRFFVRLTDVRDETLQIRYLRHLLRAKRPIEAAALFDHWSGLLPTTNMLPYASIAWRLTNDERWAWLEANPSLVGIYDLAKQLPPLDELAAHLRTLHTARGQQLEQSVRGGTQTEGNLLTHINSLIEQTASAIRTAVRQHLAQLPPMDPTHPFLSPPRDRAIGFAGSWSVRLTSGGHHANHVHPAGWLSSALYIVVPERSDLQSREGWLTFGQPQTELGLGLEPVRFVEPKPGQLVLFPSTMWHGTVPFGHTTAGNERLTIAFDVALPT